MSDIIRHSPTSPLLEELRARATKARDAKEAIELAYRRRKDELERELRAKLAGEFPTGQGTEWERVSEEYRQAESALETEFNRLRVEDAKTNLDHPEGTILVEWEHQRLWRYERPMRPTGKRAVVQVFRQGDPFPANRRWSRPAVGSPVLRELKKDGTPGLNAETWRNGWHNDYWLPEGQEPEHNIKLKEKQP